MNKKTSKTKNYLPRLPFQNTHKPQLNPFPDETIYYNNWLPTLSNSELKRLQDNAAIEQINRMYYGEEYDEE